MVGRPQTPSAVKQESAVPVPCMVFVCWPTPPVMCVPGAWSSGLRRRSRQGPRLENTATSLALSASLSGVAQPSLPATPLEALPPLVDEWLRTFSAAPAVMTFFAVPGEPTVCWP